MYLQQALPQSPGNAAFQAVYQGLLWSSQGNGTKLHRQEESEESLGERLRMRSVSKCQCYKQRKPGFSSSDIQPQFVQLKRKRFKTNKRKQPRAKCPLFTLFRKGLIDPVLRRNRGRSPLLTELSSHLSPHHCSLTNGEHMEPVFIFFLAYLLKQKHKPEASTCCEPCNCSSFQEVTRVPDNISS